MIIFSYDLAAQLRLARGPPLGRGPQVEKPWFKLKFLKIGNFNLFC